MIRWFALLPTLLIALTLVAASARGQVIVSADQPTYLDASTAKVYEFGSRVLVETTGLKPEPLSGAKIRVDRADKYLILAFRKNPTEIAALINLEPNLYLLPGKAGDVYLVIIAPLDGSPQSFNEVTIPGSGTTPPVTPDPGQPGGIDLAALQALARDQARSVGDPTIAKALGSGYVQLAGQVKERTLVEAQSLVKQHTMLVMGARPIDPAAQKNWRPFLLAIDQALTAAKIGDSKTYAAAIHAVGLGLVEAGK